MIYQRIVILCLLFGMLTLTIAEQVCAAAKQTERTHWIRENGTDVKVIIIKDNSPGLATLYVNAENCGNAAHKTSKGGRFFSHLHVHYTFPINGYTVVNNNLVAKQITAANTKAYWDNKYRNSSSGGESPTYNCWGHTFGYSTWIQDSSYIYTDDYSSIQIPEVGCVIRQTGHALKVTGVSRNESYTVVTKTSEKDQYSGIYNLIYLLPGGGNFGNFFRKK